MSLKEIFLKISKKVSTKLTKLVYTIKCVIVSGISYYFIISRHAPLQGVYNGRNLLRAKEHKAISVTFEEIRSAMVENFSLQLKDFLKVLA